MAKYVCAICKKKIGFLDKIKTLGTIYKCSKHGVVCNDCRVKHFFGQPTCPKCGNKLKAVDRHAI